MNNETFIVAVHSDGVCENTPPVRDGESVQAAMDRVDREYLNIGGDHPKSMPKLRRWLRRWWWLLQLRLRLRPVQSCPRLPCNCGEEERRNQVCLSAWPAVMVGRSIWTGLWWYGHPRPLRLRTRRSWPWVYFKEYPGCGCIKVLKDVWLRWSRRGNQTRE